MVRSPVAAGLLPVPRHTNHMTETSLGGRVVSLLPTSAARSLRWESLRCAMPFDSQDIVDAIGPRDLVEQAMAALMRTQDITRDSAFEIVIGNALGLSRQRAHEIAVAIQQQSHEQRPNRQLKETLLVPRTE